MWTFSWSLRPSAPARRGMLFWPSRRKIYVIYVFLEIYRKTYVIYVFWYIRYITYIYRYWPGLQSNFSSYFPFDSVNRPSKFSNMDQRASFPHRHPSLEPSIVIRHIPSNKSLHPIYRISHYIYIYIYIYISQYMNIITYNCVPLYLIISSYIPNLPPASSSYILFPIVFPMIFPIIFPFIIFPYYCSRKEYSEYSQYYGWLSVFPIQFYSIYIYMYICICIFIPSYYVWFAMNFFALFFLWNTDGPPGSERSLGSGLGPHRRLRLPAGEGASSDPLKQVPCSLPADSGWFIVVNSG